MKLGIPLFPFFRGLQFGNSTPISFPVPFLSCQTTHYLTLPAFFSLTFSFVPPFHLTKPSLTKLFPSIDWDAYLMLLHGYSIFLLMTMVLPHSREYLLWHLLGHVLHPFPRQASNNKRSNGSYNNCNSLFRGVLHHYVLLHFMII